MHSYICPHYHVNTVWRKTVVGKTLANPEQFAKVLPIQIYIIKLRVDSMTNEYQVKSEHAWKLQTINLLGLCSITCRYSHRL